MDTLLIKGGIYKIATRPEEWDDSDFLYWWCDERNSSGEVVHAARMSMREKERYYVAEFQNMIVSNGVAQVALYLTATTNYPNLAQYFAVGSGGISQVLASSTSLAGEFFRKVSTGGTNSGNLAVVSTALLSTDATGQWTNMGIFGFNASATLGSGQLISQALTTFNKPSSAFTVDWLVQLYSN